MRRVDCTQFGRSISEFDTIYDEGCVQVAAESSQSATRKPITHLVRKSNLACVQVVRCAAPAPLAKSIAQVTNRCPESYDMNAVYRALASHSGLQFGEQFRSLKTAQRGSNEFFATLNVPTDSRRKFHPVTLDACFQLLGIAMGLYKEACVPQSMGSLTLIDAKVGVPVGPTLIHLVPTIVTTKVP